MRIVGALDVHRRQITYEWMDTQTGEVRRGRIVPAARQPVREFLEPFHGLDTHFALEGTTGWRFVVEELHRAGLVPHLADPAETAAQRGRKRRAKTDRADCRLMLDLLARARLPESWIPPTQVLEVRSLVRLRQRLADDRRQWQQRLQAQLFHQGAPRGLSLMSPEGRAELCRLDLSPAGRQVLSTGMAVIDHLDIQLTSLDAWLVALAKVQFGCRALERALFGVGHLLAVFLWAELGDCRRFSSSDDAVRHSGLDITVWESDGKRPPGHLARQGPAALRWALYEAAQSAARHTSPEHAYYLEVKGRLNHKRACLSVARKLCRQAHHILKGLGEEAFVPVPEDVLPPLPSPLIAQAA